MTTELLSPQHSWKQGCLPTFQKKTGIFLKSFLSQKKNRSFPSPKIKETFSCHDGAIWIIKESPDGKFIVTGEEEGFITVFNYETDSQYIQPVFCIPAHSSDITDIAWSSDSSILATASFDKKVKFWDVQQQTVLKTLQHSAAVIAIDINPVDMNQVLTCTMDLTANIWDIEKNAKVFNFCLPSHPVSCAYSKDGETIAIGCLNGLVSIIKTENMTQFKRFSSNKQFQKVSSLEFTDKYLIVSSNDSKINLYSLADYSLVCTYQGHSTGDGIPRISVSKDSQYIMTPSQNKGSFIIFPIDHKKEYQKTSIISKYKDNISKTYEGFKIGPNAEVSAAAFLSKNTNHLAMLVATLDGTLYYICS